MNTHIISIGDELLIGQVINTNASWMAAELNKNDIDVTRVETIGDESDAILNALKRSEQQADVVLITGGLGPTKDDITKKVLCDYFGGHLVMHQPSLRNVSDFFEKRGLPLTEVNRAQALVPDCCTPLLNGMGTAPTMWFEHNGKIIVSMPGVPFEMQWMMHTHIIPKLRQHFSKGAILHKTVLTFGIGESFLADKIESWELALPQNFHLAYLPEAGKVRLRLTAHGDNHNQLSSTMEQQIESLYQLIGDNIYGYDDDTLSSVVGQRLSEQHSTVATAESCTGGLLGNFITETPGASAYYVGGIIAYDTRIKTQLLGVQTDILKQYGAVSRETAEAMAIGCRERFGTNYAIATTGIAGPDGGTTDKPLGTVWIAVADNSGVQARKYVFRTTRTQHQQRTANQALFNLWCVMSGKPLC